MTIHPAQSLVCPELIGRESALNRLVSLIEEVGHGRGQMAIISGEAGIGKSRLVAETRTRFLKLPPSTSRTTGAQSGVGQTDALVLQGRCFETDRTLPYAPVLDLLRAFVASCVPDELPARLGTSGPELIKLLPEPSLFSSLI